MKKPLPVVRLSDPPTRRRSRVVYVDAPKKRSVVVRVDREAVEQMEREREYIKMLCRSPLPQTEAIIAQMETFRRKVPLRSMTTILVIMVLLLAAGGLAVTGVYLLLGLPWALIAGAGVAGGFALLLRAGLTHG